LLDRVRNKEVETGFRLRKVWVRSWKKKEKGSQKEGAEWVKKEKGTLKGTSNNEFVVDHKSPSPITKENMGTLQVKNFL